MKKKKKKNNIRYENENIGLVKSCCSLHVSSSSHLHKIYDSHFPVYGN